MVPKLLLSIDNNELYYDENNINEAIEREERHDQWMILLESIQYLIMGLLISLILEGLIVAIILYVRSGISAKNKESDCSSNAEGLSAAVLDSSNLYPILNLAGENRNMYLKPLNSDKLLQLNDNGDIVKSDNRTRYSMADEELAKNTTDLIHVSAGHIRSRELSLDYMALQNTSKC